MVHIIVLDQLTEMKFRSILSYGGGRSLETTNLSPWRIMEWLSPTQDYRCDARSE